MTTVFIISAPSGSGKSTLVAWLLHDVPGLVSPFPTPPARRAEPKWTAWTTISSAATSSSSRLEHDEFLEHAKVFGNYYGTHKSALEVAGNQGQDLVLDIDVQGAAQLKKTAS